MSTRSFIGMQYPNGEVRGVYCHHDGYVKNGVGEILYKHYQDPAKISALLDGGWISQLGTEIKAPQEYLFYAPAPIDCTVFYHRERGDSWEACQPQTYNTLDFHGINLQLVHNLATIEYGYLYLQDTGWVTYSIHDGITQPLANHFE